MEKFFQLWDLETKKVIEVTAKKSGQEWMATCPKHDDKKPSLSIEEHRGVFYCHGCKWKGHLFEPKFSKIIATTYDYLDKDGEFLYQVVRFDPKAFAQRKLGKKKDWVWNIRGLPRVLYHLPEVLKETKQVFVVEGEKDADALYQWGLTATTCPMGAGKWKEEYNQSLSGLNVVLLPDNDAEGIKHMKAVGRSLHDCALPIKTKWLKLPELADKEDLSDWIGKGHTQEDLGKLARKAPEYIPSGEEEKVEGTRITKTLVKGLVHLVKENGRIKYLLKEQGNLFIKEIVTVNGKICIPKQDLPIQVPDPDILSESMDLDTKKLLEDVVLFIKNYVEVPYESHYLLLALWVFHTYLIEKFDVTPLLYFYGEKETGKTRAGEVLAEITYFCERLTSPTEATLFREAEYFKPSLVIDELKLWGPDGNPEVARLIKSRYKRGLKVSRCNLNKEGEDMIEYYDVFAPLVICTTESIPDTIESRCIVFIMEQNTRIEVEDTIDKKSAKGLRNRLTIFRSKFLTEELPRPEHIARRRLNEILMPLYQILMLINPEQKEVFRMIVEEMETSKEEAESSSETAEIIKAIDIYYEETGEIVIGTSELTKKLNEIRGSDELKPRSVGWRVKRLGFDKAILSDGRKGWKINQEKLKRLKLRYKVE